MSLIRIGLHGLILTLADLAGILGGFVACKAFDFEHLDQIMVQLPVAVALSILLFVLWSLLLRIFGAKKLLLADLKELLFVFVASVAMVLAVFVPLHFFTQGYHSAIDNLVLLAFYQMPVNLIALCGVWIVQN
jgi:hypothetical protein